MLRPARHTHPLNPMHDSVPFVFSDPQQDRLALQRKDVAWLQAVLAAPDTCFVPVCDDQNVVIGHGTDTTPWLLCGAEAQTLLAAARCTVLLGERNGTPCFALGLDKAPALPRDAALSDLRVQFGVMADETLALLGYARSMTHWHRHNCFCGRCGAPTTSCNAGHELHCPRCGNILYPRINPAIIVLVSDDDRCLLGSQTRTIPPRYSTLAGFVEPGEDLESAVRREVFEESNIRVGALHYQYSQPWPFPASLMLGFRGIALNSDICCNDGELADARWFTRTGLLAELHAGQLALPTRHSISWRLLSDWFDEAGISLAHEDAQSRA